MLYENLLIILSLSLFLYNFFPIQNTITDFSNDPPQHIGHFPINLTESYPRHFNKVVLIIIDALRWDFIKPEYTPNVWRLLDKKESWNNSCLSKILVESPTVTLPRIKALTTGNLPQYSDVLRNLATSVLDNRQNDSWLHSAVKKNMKIVFYGDNTWQKLFPEGIFTRSEGTTSFFVYDFEQVDRNVTRNVNMELDNKDWDIMILHYLGLDHIGHVHGPFSPLIQRKLRQMDNVISKIHSEFLHDNKTLILITGDHGMHDGGGKLLFRLCSCKNNRINQQHWKSVNLSFLLGHGGNTFSETTVPLISFGLNCDINEPAAVFHQTDIPLNLAVLLGINIPTTSIGTLQEILLKRLDAKQYLYALHYNYQLLLNKNKYNRECYEQANRYHERLLLDEFNNPDVLSKLVHSYEGCTKNLTNYLLYQTSDKSSKENIYPLISSILMLLYVIINLIRQLLDCSDCIQNISFYRVCTCCGLMSMQLFIKHQLLFICISAILLALVIIDLMEAIRLICNNVAVLNNCLLFISVLHPLTFLSTSFIEEEHYFWIFCSVTFFLMHLLQLVHVYFMDKQRTHRIDVIRAIFRIALIRFLIDLNSTVENSVKNPENWTNILNRKENFIFNAVFMVLNLIEVYFILRRDGCRKNLYNLLTLTLIFIMRIVTFQKALLSQIIWGFIWSQNFIFKKLPWQDFWFLVGALFLKSPNIALLPGTFYIGDRFCNLQHFKNVPTLAAACNMIANCFYFLQGHRNSLASIDVSVGYLGLNSYYPVLVFVQMLLHTYIFDILFHAMAMENFLKAKDKKDFWITLLIIRTTVACFTCFIALIFRNHLFVWSVFAPKLFIEFIHTVFLILEINMWNIRKPNYEYDKII